VLYCVSRSVDGSDQVEVVLLVSPPAMDDSAPRVDTRRIAGAPTCDACLYW